MRKQLRENGLRICQSLLPLLLFSGCATQNRSVTNTEYLSQLVPIALPNAYVEINRNDINSLLERGFGSQSFWGTLCQGQAFQCKNGQCQINSPPDQLDPTQSASLIQFERDDLRGLLRLMNKASIENRSIEDDHHSLSCRPQTCWLQTADSKNPESKENETRNASTRIPTSDLKSNPRSLMKFLSSNSTPNANSAVRSKPNANANFVAISLSDRIHSALQARNRRPR